MTIIKYGFTGTRNGLSIEQKNNIEKLLLSHIENTDDIEVHHGDCIGADKDFHGICENLNLKYNSKINIIIHPPNKTICRAYCKSPNVLDEKDYLERNKQIVNNVDILIGCPLSKSEQLRSGTWMTIRYAKKHNKSIILF